MPQQKKPRLVSQTGTHTKNILQDSARASFEAWGRVGVNSSTLTLAKRFVA